MKRIGLIVPSSNITMEVEIPRIFRDREEVLPERFSFHSARMAMTEVTADALVRMDASSVRCATELADAEVDVQAYACLVAIMSQGRGHHRVSAQRLTSAAGRPVLSSAGALVDGLHHLGVERIALMCPYLPPLAALVIDYLAAEGIEVVDHLALGIQDNLQVGRLDPLAPSRMVHQLDLTQAQAVVASACVQMPSLASVDLIQQATGLPTLSAATATAWSLLRSLDLATQAPRAGALLQRTTS